MNLDNSLTDQISLLLKRATSQAEALQARLETGEDVSDEEFSTVAQAVAEAIEEASAKLKEMVGPMEAEAGETEEGEGGKRSDER